MDDKLRKQLNDLDKSINRFEEALLFTNKTKNTQLFFTFLGIFVLIDLNLLLKYFGNF